MDIKRRDALGLMATGCASLLATNTKASEQQAADCGETFSVLVDTAECIGCRKCEWACANANELTNKPLKEYEDKGVFKEHRRPHSTAYTVVNQFNDKSNPDKQYTMKVQCMHCLHPACVSACLVGAMEQTADGPIIYDAWKCIGCRYCMVACPFQVPAYEYDNPADPQVRKCTFCYTRLTEEGKNPACVEICPNEALTFGYRDELLEVARARIRMYPDKYQKHIYGENEIGGTNWLYLASTDFSATELPKLNDEPIPEKTESIQHGIFKSWIPPIALYGLLGLIMHSAKNSKKEGGEE